MVSHRGRRLLIPAAHETSQPRSPVTPVRRTKSSSSGIRLTRAARGETEDSAWTSQPKTYASQKPWWAALGQFCFAGQTQVAGYQIYAVERWIVERRVITTLAVHTGKDEDKITVSVLEVDPTLPNEACQAEFDRVLHRLKRDGARPKDIGVGTLMVTSLVNFRSDYTIVHIPSGNFLSVRDRLCSNINLQRMGCSGRSPLMLEEPNDTTRERFIQSYSFPDNLRLSSCYDALVSSILGLVRLLQLSLFFFEKFDVESYKCDGLLCDYTLEGLERWTEEIGEPKLFLEPAERPADPTVVAALLSAVISMRNKLANIRNAHNVPRDPFKHPISFSRSIMAFLQTQSSTHISHLTSPLQLNLDGLKMIDSSYSRARQNEAYHKVRRALKSKFDDISRELLPSHDGIPRQVYMTSDLRMLVNIVTRDERDPVEGGSSLQKLWTGRFRYQGKVADGVSEGPGLEDSSDEDDDLLAHLWKRGPVKVQKTLESWTGWELGIPHKSRENVRLQGGSHPSGPLAMTDAMPQITLLPGAVISREGYKSDPNSGPESPTRRSQETQQEFTPVEHKSKDNLARFHKARPRPHPNQMLRLTSWADPFSAAAEDENGVNPIPGIRREQSYTVPTSPVQELPVSITIDDWDQLEEKRLRLLQRRHSFAPGERLDDLRVLPLDYMKIDVDICGEMLLARMREIHLSNLAELLEVLEGSIGSYNSEITKGIIDAQPHLKQIVEGSGIIREIEELDKEASDARLQGATVHYQAQQIATEKIWSNVQNHRQAVARQRARVFPIKPRETELEEEYIRQGRLDHLLPKESRFKFIANTIDARRQYVDGLGKTEEEVSEEEAIRYPDGVERKENVKAEGGEEEVHSQRSWSQWLLAQVRKLDSVWDRGQGPGKGG